jgi:hypothetical protein
MRLKFIAAIAGLGALALPVKSFASVIAAYNFGPTSTSFTYAATTLATGVTASGINSAGDYGSSDVFSQDAGQANTYYTTNPGGGANLLSVESSTANDNNWWVEMIVTAQPGYAIDPTSFELYGGAGGSSVSRSAYVFDNVDGFPTSVSAVSATSDLPPTITGGDLLASGNFTNTPSIRSSSEPLTEIQVGSFPSDDTNLSSFTVRIYFDAQNNVDKNIDLNDLELDGSVVAVPEPVSASLVLGAAGLALLRPRRRKQAAQ